MAKLKALKLKDKRYIFKAFDNEKAQAPAVCVFKSFPASAAAYWERLEANRDGGRVDIKGAPVFLHKEFANDCIEGFENFEYEGRQIKTVQDFLSLPQDAALAILYDCFAYSAKQDEFAMGN